MTGPSAPLPLPIEEALPGLLAALAAGPNAVLVAPPGAGKTTRVPLALLAAPWRGDGRIILLEPRRLAARAAADRMAWTLGETVGETVGLRVRSETRIGRRTRIEVVTEGVFTRMILADPALDGAACVIFDEFHERSLDADLGLALALDAQAGLREDLRLLPMSATLDGARVARLLGDAPVVRSEGRAHPVETRYLGRDSARRIEEQVVEATLRALRAEPGSALVFLPGAGEIRRVEAVLRERIADPAIDIAPLHGGLERGEQSAAIRPSSAGRRKVVLATSIAETSLTIEGVRIVVDCGLARVPVFEPALGLTRLETVRVSRASADQRRGRAGRTEPGVCYRLWEEAATGSFEPFVRPEILSADLAGLLLDCAEWGVTDPTRLPFLDSPPAAALAEARALLTRLDALDGDGRITAAGRRLRALPLHPRLARMVLAAADAGRARDGAELAALIAERGLGGDAVDLDERADRLRRDPSRRAAEARRLAAGWAKAAASETSSPAASEGRSLGSLVALAYPDRIAKARGRPGEYLMANGRGAQLEPHLALAREGYLAVAEVAGAAGSARILAAAAIAPDEIEAVAGGAIESRDEVVFDRPARALRARSVRRLGAITLSERPLPASATLDSACLLARGVAQLGLAYLPWPEAASQLRQRVEFVRQGGQQDWPDLSDGALSATAEEWLAPHLIGRAGLADITAADVAAALEALVPWDMKRRLEAATPTHLEVPTGSRVPIDYAAEGGPAASVRVQELFGLDRHPAVGEGRMPLVLNLLSPAGRPIQITRDLPAFWRGSWQAVRSEMRGRYPRHPWPEDPVAAAPTRRAKPRGT
jgi:ATP-dependent helicase HrpB